MDEEEYGMRKEKTGNDKKQWGEGHGAGKEGNSLSNIIDRTFINFILFVDGPRPSFRTLTLPTVYIYLQTILTMHGLLHYFLNNISRCHVKLCSPHKEN